MKRIALLLAFILILTPVLVSCNTDTDEKVTEAPSAIVEGSEFEYTLNDLRELDYGDKDFGIFIDKGGTKYLISEEEDGDLVGDAVFQRNLAIEEKFNLNFNMVEAETNQPNSVIKNYILADDKTFHMYVNVVTTPMLEMVLEGYFVDWSELEDLDYTKPYWNSRVATDINYGGKVYMMGGDLNLTTYNSTNCLIFNKNLFDDLGIDHPYQDVYDYTWTVDKMIEITRQGYADLNGDTLWDKDNDRFGFTGWGWEMNQAVYIGMGGKPIVNDEDNMPVLNLNNDRNIKIFDKIIELFDKKNAYSEMSNYARIGQMLSEGRLLIADRFVSALSINRDSDYEFGLIPYPMLDEEQGEYYSRAANIAHLCYIPTTNLEIQDTGLILEAMSIESHNKVRPTYYDITLDIKSAPDEESIDMVDIVLDSSTYIYEGFVDAAGILGRVIGNQSNTFASWYAGSEKIFEKKIEQIADFYSA